jgi:hypothetical protein
VAPLPQFRVKKRRLHATWAGMRIATERAFGNSEDRMTLVRTSSLAVALFIVAGAPASSRAAVGGRVSAVPPPLDPLAETLVLTPLHIVSDEPASSRSPIAGQAAAALVGAFIGTAAGSLIRRPRRA